MIIENELTITNERLDFPMKPKLPFRIDFTLKATSSNFKLFVGKGFIRFAGDIQESGGGILRTDILAGKAENVKYEYGTELPIDEFFELAVMYGTKATWIEVNGEKCYFSSIAPYVSALENNELPAEFSDGLEIALSIGTKRTLVVKSFEITEYADNEPHLTHEEMKIAKYTPFEWYLRGLPPEIRDEAVKLDELCMQTLKKAMKFSSSVDKYGYLTYKSACGIQYEMRGFGTKRKHSINWVQSSSIIDLTNHVLNQLHEYSPQLAELLFSKLKICSPHKRECRKRTTVTLNGVEKQVCRSKIPFKMNPSEFADIRKLITVASEIL